MKLIVKLPTYGEMIDPHHWTIPMMGMQGELITGSLNPGGLIDTAVINHYAVKSYEDWCERCDLGYPFSRNKVSKYEEWEGKKHLDSEVEDLTAKNFLYGKNWIYHPCLDRVYHLGCMLFAFQAQSCKNWLANVVVDNTPTENITWIENIFMQIPDSISFLNKRFNDWGHTRNVGLENASGDG